MGSIGCFSFEGAIHDNPSGIDIVVFEYATVHSKPCCYVSLQGIEEAGTRLAQVLTKKESIAKMKASMPPDVAKALARVSGGLYVVAAVNNTARGAMLASWVAQASFEPLGLTVAVAKDRAIESLMQVGYQTVFVLCVPVRGLGFYALYVLSHFLADGCCSQ